MQSLKIRGTIFAAAAALLVLGGSKAHADTTVTYSKWVDEVKISGDFRLREEYFDKKTQTQFDRNRQRFRLRLNTDFLLPAKFTIKTTLASGTGEQVSTNQSFDNLSSQKDIWIDKAFLVWQPWDFFRLQGGRMDNPIWRQYSSDAVWDGDFNPEGFSQSFDGLVGPVRFFANALQMVVDEDSAPNGPAAGGNKAKDQWMLGEQAGLELRLPLETRLKAAVAYYDWINENSGTFSQVTTNEGNRRTAGGVLTNHFGVLEYTGELSGWVASLPVSLQGTWIQNQAAMDVTNHAKLNNGYQAGGIFGKAKDRNTWEIAYFNKWLQTDATVADVSDSDFGDGGTNRKGHIYWIAYAPLDFMTVSVKFFDTDVITKSQAPSVGGRGDAIKRWQFDWVTKF